MINTFDRELIAHHRHQDLLRNAERLRLLAEATKTDRHPGFFGAFLTRLRGTVVEGARGTAVARA